MPKIIFVDHSGSEYEINVELGQTVMDAATKNMIPGIIGDCGGYCSCATCHAYVDSDWGGSVPAPTSEEIDLLDCAIDVAENSRLTCQIKMTDELDGIRIKIPASQF